MFTVGQLTRQKDFPTVLRAFARLGERRAAHLVILGGGGDRAALERLGRELGVDGALFMPGSVRNPYAWTTHADLYVLSSA